MCLERFSVIQLTRSDDNLEICPLGEFFVEKAVDLAPGAPMFRR